MGKKGAKLETKDDRKFIGKTDLNGNNGKINFNEPDAIDDFEKRKMKEMTGKMQDREMVTEGKDVMDEVFDK